MNKIMTAFLCLFTTSLCAMGSEMAQTMPPFVVKIHESGLPILPSQALACMGTGAAAGSVLGYKLTEKYIIKDFNQYNKSHQMAAVLGGLCCCTSLLTFGIVADNVCNHGLAAAMDHPDFYTLCSISLCYGAGGLSSKILQMV